METVIDRRWVLGLGAAAVPVLAYFAFIAAVTHNIPRGDDFFSILGFLSDWRESSDWSERLALINAQYFSHRLALTRLVALLQVSVAGECHFVALQIFGWIGWIVIAMSLAFSVATTRRRPWLTLPVFLLLMQPYGSSNLLSAMQAVQNIGVIGFALLAMKLGAGASSTRAALALATAALATFTSANGLLVAPVLVAMWTAQGRWRIAVAGAIATTLIALVYFSGYVQESATFRATDFLANAAVMSGGFAGIARIPLLLVGIAGALLLAGGAVVLLRRPLWHSHPTHLGFILFLCLSILMAAWGRMGWGADYMMQDRYRPYGLLLLSTVYVLALGQLSAARMARIGILATTCAAVFSLLAYATTVAPLVSYARWAEATAINHSIGGHFLLTSGPTWSSEMRSLDRAAKLGIYQIPSSLDAESVARLRALPSAPSLPSPFKISPNSGTLGYMLEPVSDAAVSPAEYVLAVHNGHRVVLPLDVRRAPLPRALSQLTFFGTVFGYPWPSERYVPGEYTLYGLNRLPDHADFVIAWQHSVLCPTFE